MPDAGFVRDSSGASVLHATVTLTSNQGFSNQVDQPPPDAVSEFKVVTNNESAEYGRSAGATVNVAYRAAPTASTAPAGSSTATIR